MTQYEYISEMCFGPVKSDEELVYGSTYKFTLDIKTLLMNPNTTRRAKFYKRQGIDKPPRPQNSFFLYRRDMTARLKRKPEYNGRKSSEISKIIGDMWKEEPQNVKKTFDALYRMAEAKYIEKYGNVKYQPKPPKNKKPVESNYRVVESRRYNEKYGFVKYQPYQPKPSKNSKGTQEIEKVEKVGKIEKVEKVKVVEAAENVVENVKVDVKVDDVKVKVEDVKVEKNVEKDAVEAKQVESIPAPPPATPAPATRRSTIYLLLN